jgi:hypothetical protein
MDGWMDHRSLLVIAILSARLAGRCLRAVGVGRAALLGLASRAGRVRIHRSKHMVCTFRKLPEQSPNHTTQSHITSQTYHTIP